jgi:predicted nucleic acid-binding protein
MSYPPVIIDTNKILAAILKPGRVRRRLLDLQTIIIALTNAWPEAERHIKSIAGRKGIPIQELQGLLDNIRREVIIEVKPRNPYAREAKEIAARFDPDDWPFIALALQYAAPVWTNDGDMIRHSLTGAGYKAVDTKALEMLLQGKPWSEVEEYLRGKYGGKR